MSLAVVILAAGQGTRMKSRLPKVLHKIAGRPMLEYSLRNAAALGASRTVVVLGHQADRVRSILPPRVETVQQEPQLGTGHALAQAAPILVDSCGEVVVLYGDMPLLRSETLRDLVERRGAAPASLLTAHMPGMSGFGRILRDESGSLRAIAEEKEASPEEQAITEVNCGIYCFRAGWAWDVLRNLPAHPDGEYYLTDVVELAHRAGTPIVAMTLADPDEVYGVNNRIQLARADGILRQRVRERHMLAGVTIVDPATVYIDDTVEIGMDTVIYPNTFLEGSSAIGEGCTIGPGSRIVDSKTGPGCRISQSVVEQSTLEDGVEMGPFCHLRPGAYLCSGVYLGNYAEVKNSRLGPGTQIHHFSYLGDATVGAGVNIAAGTITCNFNSETQTKSATVIEDGASIGSDTMLVAPVRIGRGAVTGAGSVVTRDVPPETVAHGVPARAARPVRHRTEPSASDPSTPEGAPAPKGHR